jgi:hypothetical protein
MNNLKKCKVQTQDFWPEKVYITPSPMGVGLHNPPIYETVYITP